MQRRFYNIDPIKLDATTAPILYAVLTQKNKAIFPSSTFAERHELDENSYTFTGYFTTNKKETLYRADLRRPIVKFQRKKNPAEFRYKVLGAVLGEGIQGAVYACIATIKFIDHDIMIKMKNNYIIKIMPPFKLKISDAITREAAEHEGLMMKRASDIFNPRNTIFDATINMYALMSKRFPGKDLFNFLDNALSDIKFTFEKRMHLAILLLSALKEIHSRKIVHRDVKLPNVIIEANEDKNPLHAWLIDLGLSVEAELDTTGGTTPGTSLYASPEAWREQRLSTAADIFALQRIYWCIFGDINMISTSLATTNLANLRQGIIPAKDVFFKQINYSINQKALDALYALFVRMNANNPSYRATMDECASALTQIAREHIPGFAISEATQQLSAATTHISPPAIITTHESDESEQHAAVASSSYSPRLYGPPVSTATAAAAAAAAAAATTAAATTAVSPTIPTCPRK